MTLAEIHYVVPQHLHRKDTHKGLYYVFRDIFFAVLVFKLGLMIEPFSMSMVDRSLTVGVVSKWCFWTLYWYCQGIILGGWWCLAHEAGHGNISSYKWVNNLIGYTLHTVSRRVFQVLYPFEESRLSLCLTIRGGPLTAATTKL